MQNDTLLNKDKEIEWQCLNCGHIYKGKTPPDTCPVCSHPKGFFAPKKQN